MRSLALRAAGVIPHVTGMTVHSIHAIVDPYVAHKPVGPVSVGRGLPGHEKQDLPYALSRRPTYVRVSHDVTPTPGTSIDPGPRTGGKPAGFDDFLAATYRLRTDRVDDRRNSEAGYLMFLARQDGP